MSHSCSLTVVSPTKSCFNAKSTPTVVLWCPEKKSCTYLFAQAGAVDKVAKAIAVVVVVMELVVKVAVVAVVVVVVAVVEEAVDAVP